MFETIEHNEFKIRGRLAAVDTCRFCADLYETMALYAGGEELESKHTSTLEEAKAAHAAMLAKWTKEPKDAPLTGKYAKLRDDLRTVAQLGHSAAQCVEDSGACNFDAPSIALPRWRAALVKQACEEAGCGMFEWSIFGSKRYVICARVPGQAYKREHAAEVMTKALASMGYDALCYQQMD